MATPITWRSLFSDSNAHAQASQILGASQNSFNSAFNAFDRIIKDRQGFEAGQAADVQDGVKQAYLDRLSSVKTPEELAALQASGELAGLQGRMTNANRGAVRGAEDTRLTGIRQSITTGQAYDDGQATVAEKPMLDDINSKVANKDFVGARVAAEGSNLRFKAQVLGSITAAERAQEMQGRADTQWGYTKTGLERADAEAKLADATKAQSRDLTTVIAREQASHAARTTEIGREHGVQAKALGFPVRPDGVPDYQNWTPKQRQVFDEEMAVIGVPPSSAMTGGDTAQGQDFYNRIAESGKYDPLVVQGFKDQILGAYNSGPKPLQGADAHKQAVDAAKTEVAFARDDASNIYAPGSVDARKAYSELSTQIPDIVKSAPNGVQQDEDVPAVQSLIGKWAVEGILIPKGTKYDDGTVIEKDLRITPSVADVQRFVRGAEPGVGGWFRDAARAETIEKDMTNWLRSSAALGLVKRGMESQQYRDGQRVNQIVREAGNPPKK